MTSDNVALDLNALEAPETKAPLIVTLGDRQYELTDISQIDFREIRTAQEAFADGDTSPLIEMIVAPEDRDEFFANRLPSFKLSALFERFNEHFGIAPVGQ